MRDLDAAMELHKQGEKICRESENLDGLRLSLNNQGVILQARLDLDTAIQDLRGVPASVCS
jgi:hypothetical protein